MTYDQAIEYLYASTPAFHLVGGSAYKPGLDNAVSLLAALGNPHESFRTIHVGGTNGKGSTSHLLAAVLQQSGLRTGLYTSPHLVDFGERIRVNGGMIDHGFVVQFVERNRELLDRIRPSFFETAMAMAFCYFRACRVEVAVIEVGLGGRLDSTNVIMPDLAVITNIGMDHTEFLGDTLARIASEKAGIIKPGVPVVIGESNPETDPVFARQARAVGAPVVWADRQDDVSSMLVSELTGSYQQHNKQTARVAIEQLRRLGYSLSDESICAGFARVCSLTGLQGRWQLVSHRPDIVLDTGHNSHGMRYVARQLQARIESGTAVRVVMGMVADKDVDVVLGLMPVRAEYYFATPDSHRALPAAQMAERGMRHGLRGRAFDSGVKALEQACADAGPSDLILVCGSNYLVGGVLRYLNQR